MKKRENILMGVGIILLVISIVGVSYAAFSYTGTGSKVNTITTGVLSMSYTESDNVISMDKALPTTDDTGKVRLRDGEYFDFTIESTIEGNAIINYEVAAEALSSNTFDGKNVKLYLTKINGTTEEEIALPKLYIPRTTANTKTGRPAGMLSLTTGSMGVSETIKYRLRMYVKEGYNPQDDNGNEVFQVKINVYGKAITESAGTLIKAAEVDSEGHLIETGFRANEYAPKTTAIVTKDNNDIPATAIASWDISEAGDGKAVAYYEENGLTDESGNPLYTLTLGGEGGLLANPNMSHYFAGNYFSYETGFIKFFLNTTTMDLTYLDTSLVTDMYRMFYECYNLSMLNLNNFDTSNVTTMEDMFSECSSLTTIDLSSFDTSNLTTMEGMFAYSDNLKTINLNNFDTSNVVNMWCTFYRCSNLNSLDVSNFDTSNVINMKAIFCLCPSLTVLNVSNFDTSSVTIMDSMFKGCSNLNAIDVSNFNTSNVRYMGQMFTDCSSLTTLDLNSFDTSKVTEMDFMFQGCSNLTTLDLRSFDTSKVTDMYGMFRDSSKLTSILVSSKWVISSSTKTTDMFLNCGTDRVTYV